MATGRPKRADLTTDAVLATVRRHGSHAFEVLAAAYPSKLVVAALQRDTNAGYLECGVSTVRPWLSPQGDQRLSPSGG